MRKIRKFFYHFPSPLPLLFIVVATVVVILYGRGYRPNGTNLNLKQTGLLSATSDPKGAQVYVDAKLVTATDNTVNIEPGWYTISIAKEGYIPWQKKLLVQGEVVAQTDPFLFPANPSLSPLTNVGIETPVVSPDGTKIAYIIPIPSSQNGLVATKAGLWTYDLGERTLGFNRDQRQIGAADAFFNFSEAQILWSPDSQQIMVKKDKIVRLFNAGRLNDFQDVSGSYPQLLKSWDEERLLRQRQKLTIFKQGFVDVATSSAKIISFSPDETKVLYEATASATIPQLLQSPLIGANPTEEIRTIEPGKMYVYDSKEDKNFFVLNTQELPQRKPSPIPLPKTTPVILDQTITTDTHPNVHWFPTSRHLVLTLTGKIDIMEYDRTNWVTVYSGPFQDNFMAPSPTGSRIIILTNLNPGSSTLPNLYTVNLR